MAEAFDNRKLKLALLSLARNTGLFAFSRFVTRKRLRILGYHGAALDDESDFRGGLFMTAGKFESRLDFLEINRYPILRLTDAVLRMENGTLPSHSTVITIDDGWLGTRTIMAPALKKRNFPATLYLSSYYMKNQTQVFNVAVDYVLWKSQASEVDLSFVDNELQGVYSLANSSDRRTVTTLLWDYANTMDDADTRQTLLNQVCAAVGMEQFSVTGNRFMSYMSAEEAAELSEYGIDIQLHTHRHRFSGTKFDEAKREIEDNRAALQNCSTSLLEHFCFPSGEFEAQQLEWLNRLGVTTATTTKPGFSTQGCQLLEMGRFLDAEQIDELEFEAEMTGFYEILRWIGVR